MLGADDRAGRAALRAAFWLERKASATATAGRQYRDSAVVLTEGVQLSRPPGQPAIERRLGVSVGADATRGAEADPEQW